MRVHVRYNYAMWRGKKFQRDYWQAVLSRHLENNIYIGDCETAMSKDWIFKCYTARHTVNNILQTVTCRMALTSAEILPTKCLIKYRGANAQYKGITIERLTCYHTKLLCTGSPLTAAAQPASLPFLRCRGSRPAQMIADHHLFEKLRSQG
jgi:hypothetical protein